jgi:type III secretion system low calcium response chaperone LcrH/SycD
MANHPKELNPIEQQVHDFVEKHKADIPPEAVPLLEEVLTKMEVENLPLKEALGFSPELIEELYQYGYSLFQSGKYEEALPVFNLLRFIDSDNERYTFALAVTYHHLKNYIEAAGNYMLCELLNPEDPLPFYHLADCFTKMDQPELAFNAMKLANQLAGQESKYAELKEKTELELEHFRSLMSGSQEKQGSSAI